MHDRAVGRTGVRGQVCGKKDSVLEAENLPEAALKILDKWFMNVFGFSGRRSGLPSVLSRFARGGWVGVGAALVVSACVVWKDDYDVMAAKYRNEAAAHEAAKVDLAKRAEEVMALQEKVLRLELSLADSRQRLDKNAESLAEAEHQYGIVEQQKQSATELVEQLRAEQERLATHLKAYASDRAELDAERERLSQQLISAEQRVQALADSQKRAQRRLVLVRDLSQRLQSEIDRKQAALLFDGDVVVVRLESASVFRKAAISEGGKRLIAATGKALIASDASLNEAQPSYVVLSQWEKGTKLRDSEDRLAQVAKLLIAEGVKGERLAGEKALVDYQAKLRALAKPLPAAPPVASGSAETQTSEPVRAVDPAVDAPPMKVSGDAILIHLVPR
jgi:DNA repair exonuclease SbcCD ATPase subunit